MHVKGQGSTRDLGGWKQVVPSALNSTVKMPAHEKDNKNSTDQLGETLPLKKSNSSKVLIGSTTPKRTTVQNSIAVDMRQSPPVYNHMQHMQDHID